MKTPTNDQLFERKLAAVVAADVVGYSRLMGLDETGTLNRLNTLRRTNIEPAISQYHSRIVKFMGDGILIEFPRVVDALSCSVLIQRQLSRQNEPLHAYRVQVPADALIPEGRNAPRQAPVTDTHRSVRLWPWAAAGTVMPFENLSDSTDREYFTDSLSEDLITDLSKKSGLLVIAGNSVFAYKGRAYDNSSIVVEVDT